MHYRSQQRSWNTGSNSNLQISLNQQYKEAKTFLEDQILNPFWGMTGEEVNNVCACRYWVRSHRCAASWEVEEGIRTVSLRHLVQHRQKLDSMSWLEERKRKKKRREGRRE